MTEAVRPPRHREIAALVVILLVGVALRFGFLGVGYFNIHAARDCFRALEMLRGEAFYISGSEMLYGGRTIGWFHYLQLMVPLFFSPSPISVMAWIATLQTAALVLTFFLVRRFFSTSAGLMTTALFAVAPVNLTMMRYMWNPAFLPLFHIAAVYFLWRWRCERESKHFTGWMICAGLAFQIHFSAAIHLLGLIVLRPWQRDRRPGWIVVGIGLIALAPFYLPHLMEEMTTGSNTQAIFTEAPRGFLQGSARTMFAAEVNPSAVPQLMRHLTVDLDEGIEFAYHGETVIAPNMTNFVHFMDATPHPRFARAVQIISWVQVPLFALGLLVLVCVVFNVPGSLAWRLRGLWRNSGASRDIAAMLLVWMVGLFAFLAVLRFQDYPYSRVVPGRYFQVWYPFHLLVMVLGLQAVCRVRWINAAVIGLLFVSQGALMMHWLALKSETGTPFYYTGRVEHPLCNVGDKMEIAEWLVEETGLTLDSFRDRMSTSGIYAIGDLGEETIDYELRAVEGFLGDDEVPPDVHWHTTRVGSDLPFPAEMIEVIDEKESGGIRALVFRITDEALIIPRQLLENNYIH